MPYIHRLVKGKTKAYVTGELIAVNTNTSLPVERNSEKLVMENMKVREVSFEMKHVKIEKKYIHF